MVPEVCHNGDLMTPRTLLPKTPLDRIRCRCQVAPPCFTHGQKTSIGMEGTGMWTVWIVSAGHVDLSGWNGDWES